MNKNQNWIVCFVVLILSINGVFIMALADDDDHEERSGIKQFLIVIVMMMIIIEGKKGGGIKRGTGMIPSIMGNTI